MKKILVCEDEAAIRDFVVINLRRAGYDVVEADCGEVALQKYEEHRNWQHFLMNCLEANNKIGVKTSSIELYKPSQTQRFVF